MADALTEAYGDVFDAKREAFEIGDDLRLLNTKAGSPDAALLTITCGWFPEDQRKYGEIESVLLIRITARDEITDGLMSRASRVRCAGVLYTIERYTPPLGSPKLWTILAREFKKGGR